MIKLSRKDCSNIVQLLPKSQPRKAIIAHAIRNGLLLNGKSFVNRDVTEINLKITSTFGNTAVEILNAFSQHFLMEDFKPLGTAQVRAHKHLSNLYRGTDGFVYIDTTCENLIAEVEHSVYPIPGSFIIRHKLTSHGFKLDSFIASHSFIPELLTNPIQSKSALDAMLYRHADEIALLKLSCEQVLTPDSEPLQSTKNKALEMENHRNWLIQGNDPKNETAYLDLNRHMYSLQGLEYSFTSSTSNDKKNMDEYLDKFLAQHTKQLLVKHYHQALLGSFILYSIMSGSTLDNIIMLGNEPQKKFELKYDPEKNNYSFHGNWSNLQLQIPNRKGDTETVTLPGKIHYQYTLTEKGFKLKHIETSNAVLAKLMTAHEPLDYARLQNLVQQAQREEAFNNICNKVKTQALTHEMSLLALAALKELKHYFVTPQSTQKNAYYQSIADTICDVATKPFDNEVSQRAAQFLYCDKLTRKIKGYLIGLVAVAMVLATAALCVAFPQYMIFILPVAIASISVTLSMSLKLLTHQESELKENMHQLFRTRNAFYEEERIESLNRTIL